MREVTVALAACLILALAPVAQAALDDQPDTAFVSTGSAETVAAATGGENFGTASDSVLAITSGDFYVFGGTETPLDLQTGARGCAAVAPWGYCGWAAGLQLPTGAQIRAVEISACDSSSTAEVRFNLIRSPKVPGAATLVVPFRGTGVPDTPGCSTFVYTLLAPETVQNDVFSYGAVFNSGINVFWNQYRVRYRLQVSPAPATASFPNDVPTTHPFFRFVEALAAAGITGGCGQGSYCPDSAVTRGQMAVFLATALGLHFPN